MRILATAALSFSAGLFAVCYLPDGPWRLWAAAVLAAAGAVLCFCRRLRFRRRGLLITFALCAALLYGTLYDQWVRLPVVSQCGSAESFTGTVCEWPAQAQYGAKVTVLLEGGRGAKAVYYGEKELLDVEPGQILRGVARWQDAGRIHETDITTFTSRGVYVLLYGDGDVTVEPGSAGSWRWFPQRAVKSWREMIRAVWRDDTPWSFLLAELTGDRSALTVETDTVLSETGLAHLFAVSGLHCAFLVSLLGLLIPPRRRRLGAALTMAVLLFYMLMVGMTPSVVRACIMQIFLLLAPLFRRDSDGITALSAALAVLLLANPYAAASISLQLSFAATLGIVLFGEKLYERLTGRQREKRPFLRRILAFAAANLSVSLAALLFTVPLTAYYFNILTLVSPLSNLLVVPAAGWCFMSGFLATLLGYLWLPLGRLAGVIPALLVRYVVWIAGGLAALPGHAVYFSNAYLRYWLLYVYAMLAVCLLLKGRWRKYLIAAGLAVVTLLLCILLNHRTFHDGTMQVLALDVGQGESVLLYDDKGAVLVDCGSSNSYIDAGGRAAEQLKSIGVGTLDAVVLTHYHADHANGLRALLSRVKAERLYLPDIPDDSGCRAETEALAAQYKIPVSYVRGMVRTALGDGELTLYPPIGEGDANEQGLTVLASSGDFEVLLTGDMASATEKELVKRYNLPDIEVLIAGHHGSRYSTCLDFLDAVQPETAIISVGDNAYGHPADETLLRLRSREIEVYRTDLSGNILITVKGGTDK